MHIDLRQQTQRYVGLDEREIYPLIKQCVSRAKTLVDVGASDGYYTVAFLNTRAAQVIACEPGPACADLLANAEANGHTISSRFRLERRLIGDGVGEVGLSEILSGVAPPIFVKVDVDGAEASVLRSIESYPRLKHIWWVIETHSRELENECISWLVAHAFKTEVVDHAWWRQWIPERRPLEHNRWVFAKSES